MKLRNVLFVSSAIAMTMLAVATPSHADSAMNACIDAFVSEHVPKDRSLIIRKYRSNTTYGTARAERIQLSAKGARSGTQIATATCVVDGSTIALERGPETTKIAAR